jgi:hypothetical protein
MRSVLGHYYIGGASGNDVIKTRNSEEDLISGGKGHDLAVIDKYDAFARGSARASGIEHCRPVAVCKTVSSYALRNATQLEYPEQPSSIQCQENTVGTSYPYMLRFAEEPTIRAADSTRHADWQTVAWSAVLFKWDGTQWVFTGAQTDWLWDRAPDEQFDSIVGFPRNYWRLFGTHKRYFVYFQTGPGIYQAWIHYHWYSTPTAPAHDLFALGGRHFGKFEDPTELWCVFP